MEIEVKTDSDSTCSVSETVAEPLAPKKGPLLEQQAEQQTKSREKWERLTTAQRRSATKSAPKKRAAIWSAPKRPKLEKLEPQEPTTAAPTSDDADAAVDPECEDSYSATECAENQYVAFAVKPTARGPLQSMTMVRWMMQLQTAAAALLLYSSTGKFSKHVPQSSGATVSTRIESFLIHVRPKIEELARDAWRVRSSLDIFSRGAIAAMF